MSGVIDRDTAIANVKDILFRSNFKEYSALDEVMTMLYQMQDAEPEITNEQAIEHLQSTGWMQKHDRILTESTWDIIRCRDCKHWREGDAYSYCQKLFNCGVLDVYDYMRAEDDFCSLAERHEE